MGDTPLAVGTRIVDDSADRYTVVRTDDGDLALYVEHWPDVHNATEYEYQMERIDLNEVGT